MQSARLRGISCRRMIDAIDTTRIPRRKPSNAAPNVDVEQESFVARTPQGRAVCNRAPAERSTKPLEIEEMWRSLFIAVGLYAVLLGVECLLIDKAVLARRENAAPGSEQKVGRSREYSPPEWAPWSLMSCGAITVLYSINLKRGG